MKILIKPHSVIDIITNSSTEIFTCRRGHSLELVEEIVKQLEKIFYVSYDYGDGAGIHQYNVHNSEVIKGWHKAGDIEISVEQGALPRQMEELLRKIFEVDEKE